MVGPLPQKSLAGAGRDAGTAAIDYGYVLLGRLNGSWYW